MSFAKRTDRKGILFTATAIVLLLSLYLLATAFSDRSGAFQSLMAASSYGDKMRFLEDDVVSRSYGQLLDISIENIERGSYFMLRFDRIVVSPSRDYPEYMKSYRKLAEGRYASLNNINISLSGFNSSFITRPHNSTFVLQKSNMTILTMPASTNYVRAITASIKLNGTFLCEKKECKDKKEKNKEEKDKKEKKKKENKDACEYPNNDPDGSPIITITWEDVEESTCSDTVRLSPEENNDKGSGRQFYVDMVDGGSAEIKYGKVGGTDGVLMLTVQSAAANVTQLDIEYASMNQKFVIEGGLLEIKSKSNITKSGRIALYRE